MSGLKKAALRGIITLAVVVALCMFFSGTIENITTPKVKTLRASQGKLTRRIDFEGSVDFPSKEEVRAPLANGQTLTILSVSVRAGFAVKKGDTIAHAQLTGYDTLLAQAKADLESATDEYMALLRKYPDMNVRTSDQAYVDAYETMRGSVLEESDARIHLEALIGTEAENYSEEALPEDLDEEKRQSIAEAYSGWTQAVTRMEKAKNAFEPYARRGIEDSVWQMLQEVSQAEEKKKKSVAALAALLEASGRYETICAEHDGYITDISIQAGSVCDSAVILYSITTEGTSPMLKADVSAITETVTKGLNVEAEAGSRGSCTTQVSDIFFDSMGKKNVYVGITDEMIRSAGSLYSMMQGTVKLTASFKSAASTTLVPSSAVRGLGEDKYVYTVESSMSGSGKRKLTIAKTKVKVLAEADGMVSVEEYLGNSDIAYMEDRVINEGSSVMLYS